MPRFAGVVVLSLLPLSLGACGGGGHAAGSAAASGHSAASTLAAARTAPTAPAATRAPGRSGRPASVEPAVNAPGAVTASWRVVAQVDERPAAWIARRDGVTLLRFAPAHTQLILHAGTAEPQGGGWRYGSAISHVEAHRVLAGFNGGFKLSYGSVGFLIGRRIAVPMRSGLGSIVTYADGSTQIGAWQQGVPERGRTLASVLQNLTLMIDRGVPAESVERCIRCWGATLGGGNSVARAALGITADGELVWAAGENLTPAALASAMSAAGVQRAVELDINPEWVAGYLYEHHGAGPVAVPVVPGQSGIPGQLLAPYSRDFFTVIAR